MASLSEQAPRPFSPDIVEAMAAARAISFAQELGVRPFILERDSDVVIKTFMAAEDSLSSFGHIVSLAKSTLTTNECISFSHIFRSGNKLDMLDMSEVCLYGWRMPLPTFIMFFSPILANNIRCLPSQKKKLEIKAR